MRQADQFTTSTTPPLRTPEQWWEEERNQEKLSISHLGTLPQASAHAEPSAGVTKSSSLQAPVRLTYSMGNYEQT